MQLSTHCQQNVVHDQIDHPVYYMLKAGNLPIFRSVQTCAEKRTVLLSTSLAWPAVAGCSWAETFSPLSSISFAQPCTLFHNGIVPGSGSEEWANLTYLPLSFQHRERESSAARTVGIVMGIFVVCWTPFFIWMPLTALFELHTPPVIYR